MMAASEIPKMETFATTVNGLSIVAKHLILDFCGSPGCKSSTLGLSAVALNF